MRLSLVVLALCLGLALAVPAPKKLEKKSISADSLTAAAPKAIEPVEQKLDEPKLNDEALKEDAGDKVDRAKKQASTTFCVEIRQNKPTQVDCDELNNRPMPPPPPPPAPMIIPEPLEPLPPPPPPPPPQIIPQEVPSGPADFSNGPTIPVAPASGSLPCEPEIAAYLIEPTGEIGYYYTGNCAAHVPALIHVPSSGLPAAGLTTGGLPSGGLPFGPTGIFGIPANGLGPYGSGLPFFNLPHGLPTGTLPGAGTVPGSGTIPTGGTPMTIQITPGTPAGSTVVPLQTGGTPIVPGAGIPGAGLPGLHGHLHAHPLIHGHPLNLNGLNGGGTPLHNLHLPIHGGGIPLQHGSGIPVIPAGTGIDGSGTGGPGFEGPGGEGAGGKPGHHHHHHLHPHHGLMPGVQCTCLTSPLAIALSKAAAAKADGSDPNGTALKLLQTMARSANANAANAANSQQSAGKSADGWVGSPWPGMSKDEWTGSPWPGMGKDEWTGSPKSEGAAKTGNSNPTSGRYRPIGGLQQTTIQQQSMGGMGMGMGGLGMGGMGMGPMGVTPIGMMGPMGYPMYTGGMMPMMRGAGGDCPGLADSFQKGFPIQGLRLSRDDDTESKDKDKEKTKEPEQKTPSAAAPVQPEANPSLTMENASSSPAIDAHNSEDKDEAKSARVARLLSPDEEATNDVDNI